MDDLAPRINATALRVMASPRLAALFRPLMRNAAVVFMLHRFADPDRGVAGYDPARLRALLGYLRRERYQLLDLETLFARLRGEGPPLKQAVVFTIDDGYREHAEIAAPLLAEFDCPATTFVATGFLDGLTWLWWDKIDFVFSRSEQQEVRCPLGDSVKLYNLRDASSKRRAADDFTSHCKRLPDPQKLDAIGRLAIAAQVDLPAEAPAAYAPMSWEQLRECERRGMTFAPHTVTHPILSKVSDADARREIVDSWTRLQREAARPIPIFAYPNGKSGDFGNREIELLRRAGLRGAVTSVAGFATPRQRGTVNGEFNIPRFPFPDELPELIQQVAGIERLKFLIRGD